MMIILSWPAKALHPNARVHWAVKAKAAKAYRKEAWAKAASEKCPGIKDAKVIQVGVYFYPPDKRRRDIDGMLSAIKSGLDGIADGLGVNDNTFQLALKRCEPMKDGQVRIILSW